MSKNKDVSEAFERVWQEGISQELETLGEFTIEDDGCDLTFSLVKHTSEYNIIKKALKRNEPVKVLKRKDIAVDRFFCPECNYYLAYVSTTHTNSKLFKKNYCPHCGQKLEWSDNK